MRPGLQGAKHRFYVATKPARWWWYETTEPVVRAAHAVIPLRYDPRDFEGTFVVTNNVEPRQADEPVPRRVFVFWTGENPLTPNRVDSLELMKRMLDPVEVLLVTPRDLPEWEVSDAPFHPVVGALSYIHRADYFRAYFLHHHGGGYADLKRPTHDWNGVFDRMDAGDSWMAGYRVPVRLMTPNMDDPRLEQLMRRWSDRRLGQSAYIARPYTPLTSEWLTEVERRIATKADDLSEHPGNERGSNPGYPVPFNSILAQVLDPLQVKYSKHLMYDQRLLMDHENYT